MDSATNPRTIVTIGEPAGIGGEILIKAVAAGASNLIVLDDPDRLAELASAMGVKLNLATVNSSADCHNIAPQCLAVLPIEWAEKPVAGTPSCANAPQVIDAIKTAASLAKKGEAQSLITNPIQKSTLYQAGFNHPGHTEYLGMIDGAENPPVMMLWSAGLKVIPLTIHIPLREVADSITPERIEHTAMLVDTALRRDFTIHNPRIAVTGLNPHAGEGGRLGQEEAAIIRPTLDRLQGLGLHISGPHAADSLFSEDRREEYDAVIAMYHDQALIPLKTLDFYGGVNVTLGLSFIRTSPDHGTALGLAGQYTANPKSLIEAIRLAQAMADNRERNRG